MRLPLQSTPSDGDLTGNLNPRRRSQLTDNQQLREKVTMKRGLLWSGLAGVATLLAAPVHGADLLSVYDQALVNDPQIREAEATRRAVHEAKPQALGALLPQGTRSAGRSGNWS